MNTILINIAKLNLYRSILHRWQSKYSDKECYYAFIKAMNDQSVELGLNNTFWINPSGLGEEGRMVYSESTANDLSLIALHAFARGGGYADSYELNIQKPYALLGYNHKKKMIFSTTPFNSVGNNFPIIGAKTGSGDGYYTLVMVCKICDYIVSGAIMNAHDEQGRFKAINELMNIGYKILIDRVDFRNFKVFNAKNACLYSMDNNGGVNCIYTQNGDEKSAPMSTTKVMTLIVARKYIKDWNAMEYITPFDVKDDDNDILHSWDKISIHDMKEAMMIYSSNVAANALARITGERILNLSRK